MKEDKFIEYINEYSKKGKGSEKKLEKDKRRGYVFFSWLASLGLSMLVPGLFALWIPFTLILFIYAARETMF